MPTAYRTEASANPTEFFTAWLYSHFYNKNNDNSITKKTRKCIERHWLKFVSDHLYLCGRDYGYILPLIDWEDMMTHNQKMYSICKSDGALSDPYYQLLLNYGFVPVYY